jgi:N-formylglutamate deformylase
MAYIILMSPSDTSPWLQVTRGASPLVVSMPHTGTEIPADLEPRLRSLWLARKDTDWWIERLYDFAPGLGATVIRTRMSRTVIDPNRDPSGASLYPEQATTELCPTTTFDGELLYALGEAPGTEEIAARRAGWFEPYHRAIEGEIARLRQRHPAVVLYDCHSIRSQIPRLFAGVLPNLSLGTHSGASCAPELTARLEAQCDRSGFSRVTNGRFKGGYTTRHYGRPADGVHAVQMELACRGYLREPGGSVREADWPCAYDEVVAAPLRSLLQRLLDECLKFAAAP